VFGKTTNEPEKVQERGPSEAGDVSIISKDMRIIGACTSSGRLRIHGRVSGDVTAKDLELTRTGSVDGDVIAESGPGDHLFVIDGAVDGTVRASRVEVRRHGKITGGVVADDAIIHGRVEGGIVAHKRLILEENAAVEGDVRAPRLALKEGGQVNGTILMGDRATADLAASKAENAAVASRDVPGRMAKTEEAAIEHREPAALAVVRG
jgi:cytoskeletal protein CcmA (bactofilin family)